MIRRFTLVRRSAVIAAAALVLAGLTATPSAAAPPPDSGDRMSVYTGELDAAGLAAIIDLGVDRHDLVAKPLADGRISVEAILSGAQADALVEAGSELAPKEPAAQQRTLEAVAPGVFRPYSGPGGLQEELVAQAAAHPQIAQLRAIGQTINGQDITAVRVTKNPDAVAEGKRPTTVYIGAQHAREWITPEMVRRLLATMLEGYGTDPAITALIDKNELWFIPVANPDGYDFTFEEGQRLWRKNLHDNNGDGQITPGDGVDLNRNYPTRWGYDDEGSSPNPASETYRGASPASEPETQALDALFKKLSPQFFVNYHSAAELLLHGIGWQVSTPSPDDVIYEAMVGDDADPAVPGYDPDLSAELYTTNGDTDAHMQEAYGTLGFTPEMTTCETASAIDPDDEWLPEDCLSGFNFPDDEELIQAEFENNLPFALAVARSAADPDDPVSVVDRDTENFRVDSFSVSYGDPQTVAVVAKKSLLLKQLNYRINNGRTVTKSVQKWNGGERYGDENTDYYAEYRGTVTGAKPGDTVEVWFSARPALRDIPTQGIKRVSSEHFSYTLAQDTGASVLVIANEDYTGVNPTYPAGTDAPKYLAAHVAALEANGIQPDTWDVDALGVPHDLAVLSHYDTVLWYLGDNRLTQDADDELTDVGGDLIPDLSVAKRAQDLTLSVRDFLNEGGKLAYAGETAGYYGLLAGTVGGLYYGLNGAPDQPCVVTTSLFDDCLILADDFTQYYLGAYSRTALAADGVTAGAPLVAQFGAGDNPVDEAGAFLPTSSVLPASEFPQFTSGPVIDYLEPSGPFIAIEGGYAAAAAHIDDGWQRLARSYDVPALAAGETATFDAQFSYATEEGYDHVIVEARPIGTEEWTTLPELGGRTSSDVPFECEAGFFIDEHPALGRYLTLADPCLPTGSSGDWNSLTGDSGGWVDVSFDLTEYAGQGVEVVVSYVTDPSTGEAGLIVDDTRLTVAGVESQVEGFETGLGVWSVLGAPEGSPGNASDFVRTPGLGGINAAVRAEDSVLLGVGLEQLATDADRARAVKAILNYLK